MLNRIFFITMFLGPIALSTTAIAPMNPVLAELQSNNQILPIANQDSLALPQDSTELPPLGNLQESMPATPALNPLVQSSTIPLTDDCNLSCLEQINGLTRRESILYGARSGMKVLGWWSFVTSNILTSRLTPFAGRALRVALGTSSGMATGGVLGAAVGLAYANRKLRNNRAR
jgi:hypothetical protein